MPKQQAGNLFSSIINELQKVFNFLAEGYEALVGGVRWGKSFFILQYNFIQHENLQIAYMKNICVNISYQHNALQ